jgi:hypothetical protein
MVWCFKTGLKDALEKNQIILNYDKFRSFRVGG